MPWPASNVAGFSAPPDGGPAWIRPASASPVSNGYPSASASVTALFEDWHCLHAVPSCPGLPLAGCSAFAFPAGAFPAGCAADDPAVCPGAVETLLSCPVEMPAPILGVLGADDPEQAMPSVASAPSMSIHHSRRNAAIPAPPSLGSGSRVQVPGQFRIGPDRFDRSGGAGRGPRGVSGPPHLWERTGRRDGYGQTGIPSSFLPIAQKVSLNGGWYRPQRGWGSFCALVFYDFGTATMMSEGS